MKSGFRRICAALLAAAAVLALSACGGKDASDGEISLLVQGYLDQLYRGELSADYGELTGVTPEQAAEVHEAAMTAETAYFCDYFRINSPSAQAKEEIAALLGQICRQTTYKTGQVDRPDKDTCIVPVEIGSCGALVRAVEALPELLADFYAKYPSGADGDSSKFEADWAAAVIAAVCARLNDAPSEKPETVTVHVDRGDDGAWAVRGGDLQAVNGAVILYP